MKAESLAKMKKLQSEARRRILQRGKIEFRIDAKLLSALLDLAREKKVPLGPMIREWVRERAEQELQQSPTQLDVIERKIDTLLSLRSSRSSA